MKSSDTTSPGESNNETSNPQEPNAQSERFDMSVITDMPKWQRVLKAMDQFDLIDFEIKDIVRSDFVKDYITAKTDLGL